MYERCCSECDIKVFSSREARLQHYIEQHPEAVERDIQGALEDMEYVMGDYERILPAVKWLNDNYLDKYPQLSNLLQEINKRLP